MQRRDFIKYTALSGGSLFLVPNTLDASLWQDIKYAYKFSKLTPTRFLISLVFDEVADTLLKPLVKSAYHNFVDSRSYSKSSLEYYSYLPRDESMKYEPYKASTVIYGVADYELYQKNEQTKLIMALNRAKDKNRFEDIRNYLKDEKAKVKLYDSHLTQNIYTQSDVTSFFEIEYLSFKSHKEVHLKNLLEITQNSSFKELIV